MNYLLLIHNDPAMIEAMDEEDKTALFAKVGAIMEELTASGELVGGQALAAGAKTVRVRGGVREVLDGPYAEMKEQFAGFLSVDVASEERAIEIAAMWPDAEYAAMEVREVLSPPEE